MTSLTTGRWVLAALLLCVAPAARAQVDDDTRPFTPFRIPSVDGILNATMPFDVKFIVWGDVASNTTDVTLEIRKANDDLACRPGDPVVQRAAAKARKWTAADYQAHDVEDSAAELAKKDVQFELLVNELDPNSFYCFTMALAPGRPMVAAEVRVLRDALMDPYRQFLRSLAPQESIEADRVEPLRQQFIEAMLAAAKARGMAIAPAPGTAFDPNTNSTALQTQFLSSVSPVLDAQDSVRAAVDENFNDTAEAAPRLEKWIQAVRAAAKTAAAADHRTLFGALPPAASGRASNMLRGLPFDVNPGDGALRLDEVWDLNPLPPPPAGGVYAPDTECPAQGAIAERCRRLNEYRGLAAAVENTGQIADSAGILVALNDQKSELLMIQNQVNLREAAIRDHLATFEGLIRESFSVLTTTNGNASTRRPWYVSADSGIAVAPSLGEVFPYIGSTMFFRPVNKAVPPSSFGTRFSVLFGFTWTDNVLKAGERQPLFAGDTTMLLGAGLRVTEWLRFTSGALVFKAVDPNPLLDMTRLRITPFFSMSADIDAADVLKNLFGADVDQPPGGRTLTRPK